MIKSHYLSNLFLALAAGFIVVVTQAFATVTVGWLAFAAGITFAIVGEGMLLRPGIAHRALNLAVAVLGVLMIIESLLATGPLMITLSFAGALGVLGLAIAGLTLHELSTERVVHRLEVTEAPRVEHEREPLAA